MRRRVRAALRAARRRPLEPFVRAARSAAARRFEADLRRAAVRACLESALRETEDRRSFFNAARVARERDVDGRRRADREADAALRFVEALALFGGRGIFTPARRAFERPIATACCGDRAPCLPSRT